MALSVRETRLQEFVDRRNELSEFRALLESSTHPVMLISGISGMGKSSLLLRLVDECERLGVTRVEIDCKDPRLSNYQKIMIAMAKGLGIEHFQQFVDLANHFADPHQKLQAIVPDINIHGDLSVGTINSGAKASAVVIEKQVNISVFRPDISGSEADRMAALTDRFLGDLEPLLAKNRVVFFFDQVENATTETRNWIWEELFRPIRGGGLAGARFVLCVQESAESNLEIGDLRTLVKRAELRPLSDEDIADYLVRRQENRYTLEECRPAAAMLFVSSKGLPGIVATSVDAFIEHQKRKAAGGT